MNTQWQEVSHARTRASVGQSSSTAGGNGHYNGKLVFASDRQSEGGIKLWTMNPDGSNPTQLTFESDRDPSLPSFAHLYEDRPKWSADGKKIAFRSNRISDPDNDPYTIYIMEYETRSVRRLILNQLRCTSCSEVCSEIQNVEWSPDGTKIAFQYGKLVTGDDYCLGGWDTDIYTVNVDGTGLVALTNDVNVVNSGPTWSPDGNQIAFSSSDQTGSGTQSIDVINADGSNRHQITSFAPDYGSTTWSPDGSKILFTRALQLFTIKPDGTELKELTLSDNHQNPRWSPDGTKIAFVRNVKPSTIQYAIFTINANGTGEQNVSNQVIKTIGDYDVDWQPLLSPANEPPPSVIGFDSGIYFAPSPPIQINIMRTGNLNQTVSCDYQTWFGTIKSSPSGTLSFAPGEASKTIDFSSFSSPVTMDLYNNAGNATFVGGIKHTTIFYVGQNGNPIDNSAFFVRQHYRDFLNREPDAAGWDFWTSNIEKCGTFNSACVDPQRVSTSASFFLSIEFQQTGYLVERIYKAAFGDVTANSTINGAHTLAVPILRFSDFVHDTQEIGQGVVVLQSGWEQQLESNKQAFVTDFVGRPAFTAAFPTSLTPDQFVGRLNANAGNTLSSSKRAETVALFGGAADTSNLMARAQALRQVAENQNFYDAEFNHAFVLMQYFGYLRRNPDDAPEATRDYSGYDFWLTKLNNFHGNYIDAEMVKAFITSIEYRTRFGAP